MRRKNPQVFSLNKIKPGMILNVWPCIDSEASMISMKVKVSYRKLEGIWNGGRIGYAVSHRCVVGE